LLEAAVGIPPRFLNQKLYQNCTKKAAFWHFCNDVAPENRTTG